MMEEYLRALEEADWEPPLNWAEYWEVIPAGDCQNLDDSDCPF